MGLFSSKKTEDLPAAKTALKRARGALEANGRRDRRRGVDYETPNYQRLNSRVIDAEKRVRRAGGIIW